MRKRNIRKEFKLSEEEALKLKKLAKSAKVTEVAIFRSMLTGYELCEKPDKEFYEIINNLGKIGTNINQIAAKANATGRIDVDFLQDMFREILEMRRELQEKYLLPKKSE